MRRWILTGLLLSVVSSTALAEEERFTFGFGPTDGEVWIKSVYDERIRDMQSLAPSNEQITRTETEARYVQQEDGSWVAEQEVRKATMEINGAIVDNPALELAVGHPMRVHFDADGRAASIEGFPALMRKYERGLDPEMYARVQQSMSAAGMERQEMRAWNDHLEGLRGQSARVGDRWGVLMDTSFQNSPIPLSGVLHFEAWTEIDGHRGIKMVLEYDVSGEVYARWEDELARVLSRREGDKAYTDSNLELHGETTWVIDPASGQLLYEVHEETTRVPLGTVDGPKATMVSRHTWRFTREDSAG